MSSECHVRGWHGAGVVLVGVYFFAAGLVRLVALILGKESRDVEIES